ncbi:SRPBCC family protein [Martelella mediterranea]|uniref:Activator of Hsp90 ATPase 1 family protein n=1 Tax=Martelella mediterranea DSM 17316 TaxID=1122214 RepID=A0A1U9Z1Z9_9HYPH|nr:SRPBCC family protein [Martelella mediterranea]AQZ51719.1 Activator of Hsp90 ATPase 1 family protein [Martelella mediterranea DSM 17316]
MTADLDPARIIRLERVMDAPRELVFKALSDEKHLDQWWGPEGFVNETHAMDFSVGGLWHYTMHGPDGKDWPNWIRYTEITPPARIAYDHGGERGEPAHFRGLILLEDEGGKTRVSLILIFETVEARDATLEFGAVEGGRQTLAKLDAYASRLSG